VRWALITAICVFTIYNGLDPRVLAGQRWVYALTFLLAGLAATATLASGRLPRNDAKPAALLLVLLLVFLLPTATQAVVYPQYVVGDLASLVLPILFWVAMRGYPSLLGAHSFGVLIVGSALAAIIAPSFADGGGRFESPSPFVVGSLWFGVFYYRRWKGLLILLVLLPLVSWLSFASGFRSSILLVPIGLLVAVFLRRRAIRIGLVLATGMLIVMPFAWDLVDVTLWSLVQESRFRLLLLGGVDESLLNRLLEYADCLSTLKNEWGAGNYILGTGHGATFLPSLSPEARNLTVEGRIHNVHITPVLILYRYGLLGLGLMLYGLFQIASGLRTVRGTSISSPLAPAYGIIVVLYVIDSTMRNNLVEPMFSFCLAALFALGATPQEPRLVQPGDELAARG
jgi:hypothetical protein